MKKIRFAKLLMQLNLLFWIIYNSYFGWNLNATSQIEENCDSIFSAIVKIALVIYILPLFDVYEDTITWLSKKTQKNEE